MPVGKASVFHVLLLKDPFYKATFRLVHCSRFILPHFISKICGSKYLQTMRSKQLEGSTYQVFRKFS